MLAFIFAYFFLLSHAFERIGGFALILIRQMMGGGVQDRAFNDLNHDGHAVFNNLFRVRHQPVTNLRAHADDVLPDRSSSASTRLSVDKPSFFSILTKF